MTEQATHVRQLSPEPLETSFGEEELQRHLRLFLALLAAACVLFAAIEAAIAVVYEDRMVAIAAIALCACGLWILRARSRVGREQLGRLVAQITVVVFAAIVVNGLAQPTGQEVVALAALLPVVAALPFFGKPAILRTMVVAWLVAVAAIAFGAVFPTATVLPETTNSILRIVSVGLICGLMFLLLWQFGNRLKDAVRDLRCLTRMSSELTQTLDPRRVGDVTARHMAQALAVDAVGICYWDRAADRLLTYGFHPAEQLPDVAESYDLGEYPLSRRILADQSMAVVSVDDPTADQAEVAYLRSIDQASMMMIPLVARGRALGIVEVTTRRANAFSSSQVALARMLADEASMALDNARLHEEIRYQAYHDPVTGLANQLGFREHLAETTSAAGESTVALLFIDLDDFKEVNDQFGHTAGDGLLRGVAERLVSITRGDDIAARFGGDEFAILLPAIAENSDAELVAQRVVDVLARPFVLAGRGVRIAASVGIATSDVSGADAEALLRDADFAMYRAKAAGKNGFATFVPGMREAA
jgi:diguanylate cyclase (GGDEF)-like protein